MFVKNITKTILRNILIMTSISLPTNNFIFFSISLSYHISREPLLSASVKSFFLNWQRYWLSSGRLVFKPLVWNQSIQRQCYSNKFYKTLVLWIWIKKSSESVSNCLASRKRLNYYWLIDWFIFLKFVKQWWLIKSRTIFWIERIINTSSAFSLE